MAGIEHPNSLAIASRNSTDMSESIPCSTRGSESIILLLSKLDIMFRTTLVTQSLSLGCEKSSCARDWSVPTTISWELCLFLEFAFVLNELY